MLKRDYTDALLEEYLVKEKVQHKVINEAVENKAKCNEEKKCCKGKECLKEEDEEIPEEEVAEEEVEGEEEEVCPFCADVIELLDEAKGDEELESKDIAEMIFDIVRDNYDFIVETIEAERAAEENEEAEEKSEEEEAAEEDEAGENLEEGIFDKFKKPAKASGGAGKAGSPKEYKVRVKFYNDDGLTILDREFTEYPGKIDAVTQALSQVKKSQPSYWNKMKQHPDEWQYERKSNPPHHADTDKYRNYITKLNLNSAEIG